MMQKNGQYGITLSGFIVAAILFGGAAITVMKLWPVYNEKMKVDMAMDKLAAMPEGARMNKLAAARALERQFDVQDVDSLDFKTLMKYLEVYQEKGTRSKLASLVYEIRAPFFSNLDIVMNYEKTVELGSVTTD